MIQQFPQGEYAIILDPGLPVADFVSELVEDEQFDHRAGCLI